MTAPAATRLAFCINCTRTAPVYQLTIDAGHPMVSCKRTAPDGSEVGCGIQVGTYDELEAIALVREKRRKIANAHHSQHVQYRKPNDLCDQCAVNPPVKTVVPHPFEAFPRKYRTAAHLEMKHHNRDMLSRLPLRSAGELEAHHRKLHDLGPA